MAPLTTKPWGQRSAIGESRVCPLGISLTQNDYGDILSPSRLRIIKPSRIREYAVRHAGARSSLEGWLATVRHAEWKRFLAVRQTFGSADAVRVNSGKTVVVFNIGGNAYRLICAIHYNLGKVFVLRFLTHADYSKKFWRNEL